jgi:hypothetical protein
MCFSLNGRCTVGFLQYHDRLRHYPRLSSIFYGTPTGKVVCATSSCSSRSLETTKECVLLLSATNTMNVSKTATSNDAFDKMMPRNEVEEASASSTIWSRLEAEKIRQGKIRTKLLQSHVEHDGNGTSKSSRDDEPMKVSSPEYSRRLQTNKTMGSPPEAEYVTSSSSTRSLDAHPSYSLPESLVLMTRKEVSSCRLQSLLAMSDTAQGEESIYLFCDGSVSDHPENHDHHPQEESNDTTQFSTAILQQQEEGETLESLGWTDFGQAEMVTESENDATMEWMENLLPFSTSTRSNHLPLLPPPPARENSWNPSFDHQVLQEVEQVSHLTNEEWIILRQRREQMCLQTTARERRNFPAILGELGYPSEDAATGTRTASDQAELLLRAEHDQRRHRHHVARARMTTQARLEFLYHTTWRILGRTSLCILRIPARLLEKRYPPVPTADTTFAAAVQPTASTVQWPESGNGWRFGEPNTENYDDDATAYWSTGTAVESDSDSFTDEINEQVSLPETFLMDSFTQTFDPFGDDTIAPLSPAETQFEV